MSQAHLHLLITHLPIFGSILGAMVLLYAFIKKNNQTKNAAYLIFIVSAIGAGIAYATGEGAEEAVEELPGVTESLISQHEQAALFAIISLIALGVLAVVALLTSSFKSSIVRSLSVLVLVTSFISFGLVARTGYLGGKIRHTEISPAANLNGIQNKGGEKDDD